MSASIAPGERGTFSAEAIWARRVEVEEGSSGLKRNLEQREARGSIILGWGVSGLLWARIGGEIYRVT